MSMMLRRLGLCAASTLCLAGCAQYVWTKPGATIAAFQADKGRCIGAAYSEVPTAPAVATLGAGYTTPQYTSCQGFGYNVNCYSSGGQYVPPVRMAYDANASARTQVFKGCMYQSGWDLVRK